MSRGPYPIMLMLAMALPGAVRALGLGEIRVDSALNEPLSAQIEILGATRDELLALTAKVADREIFQRYGADRPGFLATATFKVGLDSRGQPVLNVRSGEAFTDPLVNFLVDLRWGRNDLVREYSLLLDPAGFNAPRRAAEAALPAAPAQLALPTATNPIAAAAGPQQSPSALPAQHRIAAHETLRGIARRAGARSESQVQHLMIAIFRANPDAFDGNINRLHRGAVITLPTVAQLAAISAADAKRAVRSQMTAWRLAGRPSTAPRDAATSDAPLPAPALAADVPSPAPANPVEDHPSATLQARVEFLEQEVQVLQRQLAAHDAAPSTAAPSPVTNDASRTDAAPTGPALGSAFFGPIAAGLTLLLAGFAYARRRRRVPPDPTAAQVEPPPAARPEFVPAIAPAARAPVAGGAALIPKTDSTLKSTAVPLITPVTPTAVAVQASNDQTLPVLEVDTEALEKSYLDSLGMDTTAFEDTLETVDANTTVPLKVIMDLEATVEHVQISSGLNDRTVVTERRANIVDALKLAIDRDPHRGDLVMKLLETYFTAAFSNRQAFTDAVRKLSAERDRLSVDEWRNVFAMGREIAADDVLFCDPSLEPPSGKLADCA